MRRTLSRLGLVVLGCVLWLALTEGFVRVFFPYVRDEAIPGRLFTMDRELGWRLAPSKAAVHTTRYFRVTYTINADGFRDKPRTPVAPAGIRRVLLYGDSLIFGWGLHDGERFSDRLENELKGVEVLNHAVPGYGLDQEVLLYENEGNARGARDVMLFVGTTTIGRIHTGFIYSKYKPMFFQDDGGQLSLVRVPERRAAVVSLLYDTLSPFYLPYVIDTRIARLREAMRTRDSSSGNSRTESQPHVDELAKNVLRRAWTTAQRRGHSMSILIADLPQADHLALRSVCNETGIACLEIGVAADTYDNLPFVLGTFDRHWNANTNRLIAEQLRAQMIGPTEAKHPPALPNW